ncbi:MAG: hypothetical protein IPM54_16820 [Polyangiaceae bacterium]|nr:hypothetical protein [Polyangiaceae bacterium]
MGKIKATEAELQIAAEMATLLTETIGECTKNADELARTLKEAMKVDKLKADRINAFWSTMFNVMVAAAYCVPGGPMVKAILDSFRGNALSSASWLFRSGDSEIAQKLESWTGLKTNKVNTLSDFNDAEGKYSGFSTSASSYTNKTILLKSDLFKKNGIQSGMRDSFYENTQANMFSSHVENEATNILIKASDNRPFAGSEAALTSVILDEDAVNKIVNGQAAQKAMTEAYTKVLTQLKHVSLSGPNALTSYILSSLAANVELDLIGAHIARNGGFRTRHEGEVRLALGAKEVDRKASDDDHKNINMLAIAWDKRAWIYKSNFEECQKMLSPGARKAYPGWDSARVDEILRFKILVSAYRGEFETKINGMRIGNTAKSIIQDAYIDMDRLLKNLAFRKNSLDTLLSELNERELGAIGDHFYTTKPSALTDATVENVGKMVMDCHIFHKILLFHLGTPWISSLPQNKEMQEKVTFALMDALVTIALSRHSARSANDELCKKMSGTYPLFYGTPTLFTFFFDVTTNKTAELDFASVISRLEGLVDTMPVNRDTKFNLWRDRLDKLKRGLKEFQALVNGAVRMHADRIREDPIMTVTDHWRNELGNVCKASLDRAGKAEPLGDYIRWTTTRKDGFGSFKSNATIVNTLIEEYTERADALDFNFGAPVVSAFYAQEMSVRLLNDGVVQPKEVILLMHETLKRLIQDGYDMNTGKRRDGGSPPPAQGPKLTIPIDLDKAPKPLRVATRLFNKNYTKG